MSETETLEPPPVSWLVELQRERCGGGSALSTFQGLLVDEIVLPQSAAENPDAGVMVAATDALVEALMDQCHLIEGEFALEALMSHYVRDYIIHAKASGHAQYYSSMGHDDVALRCVASGLKSMLADPYYEIFTLMVRMKRAKPAVARKIASDAGYSSVQRAIKDIDRRLGELDVKEPLAPRHKAWLKSLRKLKVVPDAEMTPVLVRYVRSNPLFDQRRGESERVQRDREANDPAYQTARRLCEMAGLGFVAIHIVGNVDMRGVWSEGPNRQAYQWRIDTDRGPRTALFYVDGGLFKRYLAVLIEDGAALPLGSLTLGKSDYEAILNHRH